MLRILTSINLEKSRQTNAIITSGIISEFNDDLANFAPLKLNLFNSCSAWGLSARLTEGLSVLIYKLVYFNENRFVL